MDIQIGNGSLTTCSELVFDTCTVGHLPRCLRPGEPVIITARSEAGLTNIGLRVVDSDGVELALNSGKHKKIDGVHNWIWTTDEIPRIGRYSYTFTSDTCSADGTFETVRGVPRVQYKRVYVLLPPNYDSRWATAVLDATFDKHRYTLGGSADDAAFGWLASRKVIAVNPKDWGDDLQAFFDKCYPGTEIREIIAGTPEQLREILSQPLPTETFPLRGIHDLAGGDWMLTEDLQGWCVVPVYLNLDARQFNFSAYERAGIRVLLNLRYSYAVDDGGQGTMPPVHQLLAFERACVETMERTTGAWGFVFCNEQNNEREWPAHSPITPSYFLESYNRVWAQKPPEARLSPGAIDCYNPGWGDWRESWNTVLRLITGADFLSLHAYCHGPGPQITQIRSTKRFEHKPLDGVFYDLRVLESQQRIIPGRFAGLPQIVTETNHYQRRDGSVGWDDDADEYLTECYRYFHERGIAGACAFRFNFDQWRMSDKPRLLQALKELR